LFLATFRGVTPLDRCAASLCALCLANRTPKTNKMMQIKRNAL
jgi:hypothetical protein